MRQKMSLGKDPLTRVFSKKQIDARWIKFFWVAVRSGVAADSAIFFTTFYNIIFQSQMIIHTLIIIMTKTFAEQDFIFMFFNHTMCHPRPSCDGMTSPLLIMDQVTGKSTFVTRHNQLNVSIELTGYVGHIWVWVMRFNQPSTMNVQKGIRDFMKMSWDDKIDDVIGEFLPYSTLPC